jgi:hypothetical protein
LRLIKANLVKGIKEGVYRKEIDPEILAIYRLETGLVPFNSALYPFSKFDIGKVTLQIIENFVYGVMSLEGIKLMEKYKEQVANASLIQNEFNTEDPIEYKSNQTN